MQYQFLVRSQLGPSYQSGSSSCAGLQVIRLTTDPSKGLPQLVLSQNSSKILPPKYLGYSCMPLHQGSLISSILGKSQCYSFFFMEIVFKGKQHWRLPLFCGQVCLLSNQIAGFFYHQYHWQELIDIIEFLHGDNHQGNLLSETTTFV